MALNKVEICGVDTSKLPLLKEKEKRSCLEGSRKGMKRRKKLILREFKASIKCDQAFFEQ